MENLFAQIKRDGITTFIIRALNFILRKTIGFIWRTEIIYECSLERSFQEVDPKIKVTIRAAVEDDIEKFKGIVNERKIELFRERFKKDRICFIALDKIKIAYFGWISFEDEYETNCQIRVKVKDKEAYWFDCYTVPEYRHNGLHSAITIKALLYLKGEGCKKVLTLVLNNNTYSRKAFRKVGFKEKKIVTLIKIFNLKYYIWRDFKEKL
jgi:ribosomal protein S18 acetylase RimI-like enzyme